jgi:hypothetical protein
MITKPKFAYEQACVVCGKWLMGSTSASFDYIVCRNKKCQEDWQEVRSKLLEQGERGKVWMVCTPKRK